MKQLTLRSAAFFCFMFLFAVLLVGGWPRLIAQADQAADQAVTMRLVPARIDAQRVSFESASGAAVQHSHREKPACDRQDASVRGPQSHAAPCTDTNGNILFSVSYMRSVYQAFALGDGFA